jgi:hypothetical protein
MELRLYSVCYHHGGTPTKVSMDLVNGVATRLRLPMSRWHADRDGRWYETLSRQLSALI